MSGVVSRGRLRWLVGAAVAACALGQTRHSSAYRCCLNERTLKVGLSPASFPPYYLYDEATATWSGYIPSLFDRLAAELGIDYRIVPQLEYGVQAYSNGSGFMAGDYDTFIGSSSVDMPSVSLFDQLQDERFVGTADIVTTYTTGLVYREALGGSGRFALFQPFSNGLWLALICTLMSYALLLMLLGELDVPWSQRDAPRRTLRRAVGSGVATSYHVLAACFGGDDYEWSGSPRRMLRLSFLALILVSASTYTANLASFFNQPAFRLHGPTDAAGLARAVACVAYDEAGLLYAPFVKSVYAPPPGYLVPPAESADGLVGFCLGELRAQRADVFLTDAITLHEIALRHCTDLRWHARAPCPLPHATCPMPHAPCPMPHAHMCTRTHVHMRHAHAPCTMAACTCTCIMAACTCPMHMPHGAALAGRRPSSTSSPRASISYSTRPTPASPPPSPRPSASGHRSPRPSPYRKTTFALGRPAQAMRSQTPTRSTFTP